MDALCHLVLDRLEVADERKQARSETKRPGSTAASISRSRDRPSGGPSRSPPGPGGSPAGLRLGLRRILGAHRPEARVVTKVKVDASTQRTVLVQRGPATAAGGIAAVGALAALLLAQMEGGWPAGGRASSWRCARTGGARSGSTSVPGGKWHTVTARPVSAASFPSPTSTAGCGHPDPPQNPGQRADGKLPVERHGDHPVEARAWPRVLEDLVIALHSHRLEAGPFERGDRLLAGDAAGQPAGHAGTGTSIEVMRGGARADGGPSSSR